MDKSSSYLPDKASASNYARSVKGEFEAKGSRPRSSTVHTSGMRRRSGQTVQAGPEARIVVDRSLTREERNALQDIGRVIAHLLNK